MSLLGCRGIEQGSGEYCLAPSSPPLLYPVSAGVSSHRGGESQAAARTSAYTTSCCRCRYLMEYYTILLKHHTPQCKSRPNGTELPLGRPSPRLSVNNLASPLFLECSPFTHSSFPSLSAVSPARIAKNRAHPLSRNDQLPLLLHIGLNSHAIRLHHCGARARLHYCCSARHPGRSSCQLFQLGGGHLLELEALLLRYRWKCS